MGSHAFEVLKPKKNAFFAWFLGLNVEKFPFFRLIPIQGEHNEYRNCNQS